MTDVLTGEQWEWIALWRGALRARDWTHLDLDAKAGLCDGYASKILCGARAPSAPTIARINRALGITLQPHVTAL